MPEENFESLEEGLKGLGGMVQKKKSACDAWLIFGIRGLSCLTVPGRSRSLHITTERLFQDPETGV